MPENKTDNLNHALSTRYYQPGTLEKDLWFRVADRDYTELINAYDFGKLFSHFPTSVELLDVGCGTGKFPSMLSSHIPHHNQIQYDYLDPSQHSLDELKKSLSSPFTPRTALRTTLETLECSACPSLGYQVIWCLQSLYCVQHEALGEIMEKLYALLNPSNGVVLIYLASSDAFYHRLYNLYNQEIYPGTRQAYITAEDVTMTLDNLGIQYRIIKLHFPHTITCADKEVLENYINQCVFDPEAWKNKEKSKPIRTYLESFKNGEEYRFPQEVWLITYESGTKSPSNKT